jgi:hypothetical protein
MSVMSTSTHIVHSVILVAATALRDRMQKAPVGHADSSSMASSRPRTLIRRRLETSNNLEQYP